MSTTTDLRVVPTLTVAIDAAALKAAVTKLKPVLTTGARRSYSPVLGCIRFDSDGTDITLTGTDLDTTISTVVTGEVAVPGSLLVPSSIITKLLGVRSKGTVEVTGSPDGGSVRNGNARLEFEHVDLNEYPKLPEVQGRSITLNLDAIKELLPAVSTDDTRPILTSVYVGDGTYAATDSYRLHVVNTPNKTGEAFLLPREAAKITAKYAGTVAARVGERDVTIVLDETTTLSSRLVEGEFPQFRNLIPTSTSEQITFTDAMVADLKTLTKLQSADPSIPVRIDMAGDGLELRCGTVVVTTPGLSTLGAPLAFNPKFMLEALTGTTSNTLRCIDTLKPALVREATPEYGDGTERIRLIMPVRVS